MKKILAVMLLALPFMANADEADTPVHYDLMINGLAVHTAKTFDGQELNGVNPGIGVRIRGGILDEDGAFVVGNYLNSFKHESIYALYEYTPIHYKHLDLGGFAGVVSGYTTTESMVDPFAAGGLANIHFTDRAGLQVRFVPGNVSFVSFNFIYQIGK